MNMKEWEGSEAQALEDSGFTVTLDPDCEQAREERAARHEEFEQKYDGRKKNLERRYQIARNAKVGSTISCPVCSRSIVKTTYHKVFCSNNKTLRGRSSCKDQYWNFVNPRGEGSFDFLEK
jgi:hypothetical protein